MKTGSRILSDFLEHFSVNNYVFLINHGFRLSIHSHALTIRSILNHGCIEAQFPWLIPWPIAGAWARLRSSPELELRGPNARGRFFIHHSRLSRQSTKIERKSPPNLFPDFYFTCERFRKAPAWPPAKKKNSRIFLLFSGADWANLFFSFNGATGQSDVGRLLQPDFGQIIQKKTHFRTI